MFTCLFSNETFSDPSLITSNFFLYTSLTLLVSSLQLCRGRTTTAGCHAVRCLRESVSVVTMSTESNVTYEHLLCVANSPSQILYTAVSQDDFRCKFDTEPVCNSSVTSSIESTEQGQDSHLMNSEDDTSSISAFSLQSIAKHVVNGTRRNLWVAIEAVLYNGKQSLLNG